MIKIYKIVSENTNDVYVGSTTQRWVCDRFSTHNVQYRRYCKGLDKLWVSSFDVLKHGDCSIIVIEETDDKEKEKFWIKELNAINKKKLCFGKNGDPQKRKEYTSTPEYKERRKKYMIEYRKKNLDKIKKNQNEKVQCPHCEKMYSKNNLKRHIKLKH